MDNIRTDEDGNRFIQMEPPTWEYACNIYLTVMEDGTPDGKAMAREELLKMARIADEHIAMHKKAQKAVDANAFDVDSQWSE